MNFVYYIVRKEDMVILDGAEDMVGAINIAQQASFDCLILQGCVITEVSAPGDEENGNIQNEEAEVVEPEVIE